MKTSKILVFATGTFFLIFLLVFLLLMKKDMNTFLGQQEGLDYSLSEVPNFNTLVLSSNYRVTIRRGRESKIELASENPDSLSPVIDQRASILSLKSESHSSGSDNYWLHAKITVPAIHTVEAFGNTVIDMNTYWSDSLVVILHDSSSFVGKNLDFTHIIFQAKDP